MKLDRCPKEITSSRYNTSKSNKCTSCYAWARSRRFVKTTSQDLHLKLRLYDKQLKYRLNPSLDMSSCMCASLRTNLGWPSLSACRCRISSYRFRSSGWTASSRHTSSSLFLHRAHYIGVSLFRGTPYKRVRYFAHHPWAADIGVPAPTL